MTKDEQLKQLIENAARLLGLTPDVHQANGALLCMSERETVMFNPLDPERGDLMKVAMAAELAIDFSHNWVNSSFNLHYFEKGDYQSLATAVLRAASAVYKSRGGV